MSHIDNRRLEHWIALNVTKTLRRLPDEEYAAVVAMCEEANREPHPNLELTTPYRFKGQQPKYTTDPAAAMDVLKHCMVNLDRLTGRTSFQITLLYDEGGENPWVVLTDSGDDADDATHGRNLASAGTLEMAICRFCKNLHDGERGDEPANEKAH